jgi:hypothetical protein
MRAPSNIAMPLLVAFKLFVPQALRSCTGTCTPTDILGNGRAKSISDPRSGIREICHFRGKKSDIHRRSKRSRAGEVPCRLVGVERPLPRCRARVPNKLGYVNVTAGTLAVRFAGSDDLFRPSGRAPWNSINYITCHDGMTLPAS